MRGYVRGTLHIAFVTLHDISADCLLCSDCALSDGVILKFDPPHRPTHVMEIIPGTSTADKRTGTDLGAIVDPSTQVSHEACTIADVQRLEARMNSMEEKLNSMGAKLNDTTTQMSAILASITELLARVGTSTSP